MQEQFIVSRYIETSNEADINLPHVNSLSASVDFSTRSSQNLFLGPF